MKETKDLLRKLDPVLGRRARGLWYLNLFSKDSREERDNKGLLRMLADRKAKVSFQEKIRLPPPTKERLSGEYRMGTVIYPEDNYAGFGLHGGEFIKHILTVGMTGSGKTNL